MHVMITRTTTIASSMAAADPTLAPITAVLKLSAKVQTFKLKKAEIGK